MTSIPRDSDIFGAAALLAIVLVSGLYRAFGLQLLLPEAWFGYAALLVARSRRHAQRGQQPSRSLGVADDAASLLFDVRRNRRHVVRTLGVLSRFLHDLIVIFALGHESTVLHADVLTS